MGGTKIVKPFEGPDRVEFTDVLEIMADEVEHINITKGWYDTDRTFGDDIALLHSEVSEALEAYRDHKTERYCTVDGQRIVLAEGQPYPPGCKPEGVGSELADVLVRLLDTAQRYKFDLFAEWRAKVTFNATRPARHGGKAL